MSSAICSMGLRTASWAISRLLFTMAPCRLVADGGGGELGHEAVLVEALEREGGDEVGCAPGVHELGQGLADDRRGLEAVGAPAGADVEVLDLGPAQDRAVVGAELAQPGPRAQQPRALELGEELERMAGDLLQEVQGALHAIGRPRLDLG